MKTCDRCSRNIERYQKFITLKINKVVSYRHEKCPEAAK